LDNEFIDITLPGKKPESGTLHPITKITLEIQEIFASIGFSVAEGPEIDFAKYNFDYLNTRAKIMLIAHSKLTVASERVEMRPFLNFCFSMYSLLKRVILPLPYSKLKKFSLHNHSLSINSGSDKSPQEFLSFEGTFQPFNT
jgi:hypothetical protein